MTDRDVYLKLAAMAEELAALAEAAESVVGQSALQSAARTVAGMAKAIYEHALDGDAN
jgi:hypothetical protein